jgi:hypothetical protein
VKRLIVVLAVLAGLAGCESSSRRNGATDAPAVARRGRTQMWADNCNRCHSARPASWYSRREWEVAMLHMQVRGYLTGEETRGVSEFFRAAK